MSMWTISGIERNAVEVYLFIFAWPKPQETEKHIKTVGKQSKHNPFLQPRRRNK